MSKPICKTCSRTANLTEGKLWLNTKNGYWYTLWEGKPKALHRLLAETYLANPKNLKDVHHKDGDRNNNRLDNLEWCTRSENIWHSYNSHGRLPPFRGRFNELHHNSVPVKATNIATGEETIFPSIHEAGRSGFLPSKISLCINGKRGRHKGHFWERV